MSNNHLLLNTSSQPKIEAALLKVTEEHFKDCFDIVYDINATNGHIIIRGFVKKMTDSNPDKEFIIKLPKLYKQSLKNEQGAFYFDQKCRQAIYENADYFYGHDEFLVTLYLKTEISDDLEEIVV